MFAPTRAGGRAVGGEPVLCGESVLCGEPALSQEGSAARAAVATPPRSSLRREIWWPVRG